MSDLQCLAELLYLVVYYKRRGQPDLAIQLLQDFIKIDAERQYRPTRILSIALYNLAELCREEGDRILVAKLYRQAVDLWNEIEPHDRLNILWYQDAIQRLQEESNGLILWGARLKRKERHVA